MTSVPPPFFGVIKKRSQFSLHIISRSTTPTLKHQTISTWFWSVLSETVYIEDIYLVIIGKYHSIQVCTRQICQFFSFLCSHLFHKCSNSALNNDWETRFKDCGGRRGILVHCGCVTNHTVTTVQDWSRFRKCQIFGKNALA